MKIIICSLLLLLGCASYNKEFYRMQRTADLEVYMLELKERDIPIMITSLGLTKPNGYNSLIGVGVSGGAQITTPKIIKYIDISVSFFNAVNDKLSSSSLRETGPLKFGDVSSPESNLYSEIIWNWETLNFQNSAHCIKIDSIKVEYMDGKINLFKNEEISKLLAPEEYRLYNSEFAKKYYFSQKRNYLTYNENLIYTIWPCDF